MGGRISGSHGKDINPGNLQINYSIDASWLDCILIMHGKEQEM